MERQYFIAAQSDLMSEDITAFQTDGYPTSSPQQNNTNHTNTPSSIIQCTSWSIYTNPHCLRYTMLLCISLITLLATLIHLGRRVYIEKRFFRKTNALFVLAAIHVLLLSLNYLFISHPLITFAALTLRNFEFCVVFFFLAKRAARVAKNPNLIKYVLVPALVILILFFLVVYVVVAVTKPEFTCHDYPWLAFSSVCFVLCLIFVILGIVINRKLQVLRMSSLLSARRRQLWMIIIFHFVVASIGFIYDITVVLYVYIHQSTTCISILSSHPVTNVLLGTFIRMVTNFLPVWVYIYTFTPQVPKQHYHRTNTDYHTADDLGDGSGDGDNYPRHGAGISSLHSIEEADDDFGHNQKQDNLDEKLVVAEYEENYAKDTSPIVSGNRLMRGHSKVSLKNSHSSHGSTNSVGNHNMYCSLSNQNK